MEVIIPVIDSTLPFCLEYVVPALLKHVKGAQIILLGRTDLKDKVADSNIGFADEDSVFPHMTLGSIKKVITERGGLASRAGWYFQQFLKMAWAYKTTETRYLVWDSDTIPLHDLFFFDGDKIFYNQKTEYHKPYFQTIDALFHGRVQKKIAGSFIAEHMAIDTQLMKQMLEEISGDTQLQGNSFWEKILFSVPDTSLSHSGFSEFETYGNYVMTVSNVYSPRALRSLRSGRVFLGTSPSKRALEDVRKYYDLVSIESPNKSFGFVSRVMPWLTRLLRGCFVPFPVIVRMHVKIRNFYFRVRYRETLIDLEGC